jgi:N-acetylneuraminic acid mutarotase
MRRHVVVLPVVLILFSLLPANASDYPSTRIGVKMIYDPAGERILLFGGSRYDNGYTLFNDLWSYQYGTNTWAEIDTPDSPGGRFSTPLVYDPDTHQLFVFSGFGADEESADMFTYDIVANTWTRKRTTPIPSARSDTAIVYDEKYDKVIMFSGFVHLDDTHPTDTWAYDVSANTWERMSPKVTPKGQYGHRFAYDSLHERVLMLGGHWSEGQSHGYTDGLWQYDYGSDTWTLLQANPAPPPRYWHTLTYNTGNGEVTVFSGSRGGDNLFDDAWILDTETMKWREVESKNSPNARCVSDAVYDPVNNVTLIFGGTDFSTYFNDLWALDSSGQWRQLTGDEVHP